MTIELTLPWPPSANHNWRNVDGKTLLSKSARDYRKAVADCVLDQLRRYPKLAGRLTVLIEAYPPDKRRRDLDNLLKGVLDSLTHAGVWLDDAQIDALSIQRMGIGGMVRVSVKVRIT